MLLAERFEELQNALRPTLCRLLLLFGVDATTVAAKLKVQLVVVVVVAAAAGMG